MAHRHTFSEAHATQRTGGKNPSHDTADNATNAVHTEDIAGIIHPQQAFEHSNAPQARQTSYHADNQRAANPNVATRWRHADQTGNRARTRSQQRRLTTQRPFTEDPAKNCRRRCDHSIHKCQCRDFIRRAR